MSDTFDHAGDAWESLQWDDTPTNYYPKPTVCKKCGEKGLQWKQTKTGKWWLTKYSRGEGMVWHTCEHPSS